MDPRRRPRPVGKGAPRPVPSRNIPLYPPPAGLAGGGARALSRHRSVALANRATHVSNAFIVEHNNKLRLVFNLRHINEHCRKYAVRYEPLSAMRRDSAKYDWMWSIDLTDAYHHIGLHEDDVHYFTFELEIHGVVHRLCTPTLNFGWTNSPAVFTECCRVPTRFLRTGGSVAGLAFGSSDA